MKKITLLLVSIISIGLATVSCSKKDSETSIEGKWIQSQEGSIVNGTEVLTPYTHNGTCEKDYSTFNGGTLKDYTHVKVNNICTETIGTGTYTRNGSELKVVYGTQKITATILNLTDSELKLSTQSSDRISVAVFTKG